MVQFLKTFLLTLLVLGLVFAALPALLQLLDAPSFAVGGEPVVLLSWRNEASGTQIQFNTVPLILLAGLVGLVTQWRSHRDRAE